MKEKNTATPWTGCKVLIGRDTVGFEVIAHKEREPKVVARCAKQEDMRLIVKAVNAYEKLNAENVALSAAAKIMVQFSRMDPSFFNAGELRIIERASTITQAKTEVRS